MTDTREREIAEKIANYWVWGHSASKLKRECADEIETAIAAYGREQRAEERAGIVDWLRMWARKEGWPPKRSPRVMLENFAAAIERGEHGALPTPPDGESGEAG